MEGVNISGIQQVGIGVPDVHKAWSWYKKYFGFDVRILEDSSPAEFMLPYTGGKPRNKHAAIAITLQGGGGIEIWRHTDFDPRPPLFDLQVGDLGVYAAKIKCKNVHQTYEWFKSENQNIIGELFSMADREHFFVRDTYNNLFQLVPGNHWFRNEKKLTGGGYGAIIGCSDMDKSMDFYQNILDYDTVVYDNTGQYTDLQALPGGNGKFRRVLLRHSKPRSGPFSRLFGESEIELIQALDRKPNRIFEGRYWGELGFIHLCFDIQGMDNLRRICELEGYPFTVDTGKIFKNGKSFDMGDAAGIFAYIEDPDGTLIEFVETHKLPVIKKLGLFINLKKRKPGKSLPLYVLNALRFLKAKDIGEPVSIR